MTTPDWNFKQVILRVFDSVRNALRVLIVNDLASPVPVTVVEGGGTLDTTPTIFNVACAIAGTEYNQALPANTRRFVFKARKGSKVDFAYEAAATEVLTLNSGVSFRDDNTYVSATLYFKCSKADEVIEIAAYV